MNSKVICLLSRAKFLAALFEQGGRRGHLDEAIALEREAHKICPPDHPMQPGCLTCLSIHLDNRYKQFGDMTDLEEALAFGQDALEHCRPGHPDRSVVLNNLSICLSTRYSQLGTVVDLNNAISFGREVLALRPPGHPDRSISLNNLAHLLSTRYNQHGRVEDLNEAIVFGRDVLALRPSGHSHRSMPLDNLGVYLSLRYDRLGVVEDIVEAIVLGRDALALCPPLHPDRLRYLDNLAARLYILYNQLGDMENLSTAIALARDSLVLRPPGHTDRPTSLSNLGAYLAARYNKLREIEDLNEAIILSRDVVALCTLDYPNCSIFLSNLAHYLADRYEQLKARKDLDEALCLAQGSLALLPLGHFDRSRSLDQLAGYLYTRFIRFNRLRDKDDLFSFYSQIVHTPATASSADLFAARAWVNAAEHFQHPTALLAYETSLRLLVNHLTTLPSLPQNLTIIKDLVSSLAVDAFSACIRHQCPVKAVELLEQGRGVFWTQLERLRSPLGDVIAAGSAGKALADKFMHLTSLIRNAIGSTGDQHDRVCGLNAELERVVAKIRELPGLSRFLLPLLFSDLQQAAIGGPVIILNASVYGCDAVIVLFDRDPVHIPLQITRDRVQDMSSEHRTLTMRTKKEDVTKCFVIILREIWDKVVSPIVDFLQTVHPYKSRIWWCPTADFSLLPLHAAGSYRKGQRKLSDLYISSYAPTLTALIRARRSEPTKVACNRKRFIAIGQAKAAGESKLPCVDAELENVRQRVGGFTTFSCIDGPDSSITRVSEELNRNEWVHFACHGIPNRKRAFESAFCLHDGHFTIEHIIRCEPKNGQFAYLSACHTTVGDEESPDEMIHLASAMQFVGFRSVIGTMWAVDDEETKRISSMFYHNMIDESAAQLDHTRAAFALHKTMQTLVDVSFDQRMLYVHMGV